MVKKKVVKAAKKATAPKKVVKTAKKAAPAKKASKAKSSSNFVNELKSAAKAAAMRRLTK